METEQSRIAVGIDIGREHSQITFRGRNSAEPVTVTTQGEGGRSYLIPTPEGLVLQIEQRHEDAPELLAAYFRKCFALMKGAGSFQDMSVTVTMPEVKRAWADTVQSVMEILEIPKENFLIQSHLESYYYYVMYQKKELSVYRVALLEYGSDNITAWELWMERRAKPVLVRTRRCFRLFLDGKVRKGRGDAEWDRLRDELLHKQLEPMFENTPFSSVYLVGSAFETGWMEKSLKFLCRKRHVFQGHNLYTKGACYAAMELTGEKRTRGTLYMSADMVEQNLGMWMYVRGEYSYYPLVNAGINWYMARNSCEFLMNESKKLVFYSRSIRGEELEHTIELDGLPDRPERATRIRLTVRFWSADKCVLVAEDLGLGEFFPASGKKWEAVLKFS